MFRTSANPFYAARRPRLGAPAPAPAEPYEPIYARLPRAPKNASPVPHLTSLYHFDQRNDYGDRKYPGNCGGNLIKDLLSYFRPLSVLDPMAGSGTCRDVCKDLGIYCWSSDIHNGADACDPSAFPAGRFQLCWVHPPYWRMKFYSTDPRDLSRAPTLDAFLTRYKLLLENCCRSLTPDGKLAVLIGDYIDRQVGFVPLTYHAKRLAFECGLKQSVTDIIRFSHGASSSTKVYRTSFIPGLHDTCVVFELAA